MSEINREYSKKAKTLEEIVLGLVERGLIIGDVDKLKKEISFVGYYRLSGYMLAFLRNDGTDRHKDFLEGTTFEQVLDAYTFDSKLRLLTLEFLELVEIGIKSIINDVMCPKYGPHWYLESSCFLSDEKCQSVIRTIKRQINFDQRHDPRKIKIELWHYFSNYSSPSMPPFWMICETISFGLLTRLFRNLRRRHRVQIANLLDLNEYAAGSWIHTMSFLRNCCAHFVRVWDRDFSIAPVLYKSYETDLELNEKFHAQAVVLQVLSRPFRPNNSWARRLKQLFDEHHMVDKSRMGFPENWNERAVWQDRISQK